MLKIQLTVSSAKYTVKVIGVFLLVNQGAFCVPVSS